jgi:hypothetical protein
MEGRKERKRDKLKTQIEKPLWDFTGSGIYAY